MISTKTQSLKHDDLVNAVREAAQIVEEALHDGKPYWGYRNTAFDQILHELLTL